MRNITYFLLCLLLATTAARGQVTLLNPTGDGGFETGSTFAANNWTSVLGTNNKWAVTTAATAIYAGSYAVCIGTATTVTATNNAAVSHMYRDFSIPAGATAITLSFYLKMPTIDNGYDYMNVYYTTTSNTPVAGTLPGTGYNSLLSYTTPALSSYTLKTLTVPSSLAGTTVRIVFTYKNDGVTPAANPSIDNIQLNYCAALAATATASPVTVCQGASLTLAGSAAGATYSWAGPNSYSATGALPAAITAGTVSAGVYTLTAAVGTCSYTVTTSPVTVTPLPGSITGITGMCVGGSTTLFNSVAGGTWYSQNTSLATVNASTGQVFGVSAGSPVISYATGCGSSTTTATVAGAPAAISGVSSLCHYSGGTVNLFPAENWESGVPSTAGTSVDGWNVLASSLYLSRVSTGTSPTVSAAQSGTYFLMWNSYYASSGTTATLYSPSFSMSGITGATLSMWVYRDLSSSSYTTEGFTAYINTTNSLAGATSMGFVPRAAALATTGSYIAGTSTTATAGWYQYTFTIPSAYTGTTNYILISANSNYGYNCYLDNVTLTGTSYSTPSTATFTDAVAGGTWSSSATSVATVGGTTGIVSAAAQGLATISYTNCSSSVTQTIAINDNPGAISGATSLYIGCTSALANTANGGTWSSSNTTVASVNASTGIVSGIAAGAAVITYSNGCGIAATTSVTVNAIPAITGSNGICTAAGTTLVNAMPGGTWSSGNPAVATISAGGVVTGSGIGVATITYTPSCGAYQTFPVTVSGAPAAIGGVTSLCHYGPATVNLFPAESWESGVPSTAGTAVDGWNALATSLYLSRVSSGTSPTVSAAQSGTYFLMWNSYYASSGTNATIYSPSFSMAGITGATLSMWVYRDLSSSSYATEGFTAYVNTTNSLGGALSLGFVPRSASLATTGSYITGTSTTATAGWYQYTFTIPASYSGATNYILINANSNYGYNCYLDNITLTGTSYTAPVTTTLTDAVSGGSWASGNTSVATIGAASGVLSAVSQGNTTVSYSNCSATVTQLISVKDNPGPISGTTSLYTGCVTTFSNAASNGSWSSSNATVASVNATTGVVTALSAGTAVITYSNGCGTAATAAVTVNAVPAIAGSAGVCIGNSVTLTNSLGGGSWSTSNAAVASITSAGVVTGLASGTATITYTPACGNYQVLPFTVSGAPVAIGGAASLCHYGLATVNLFPAESWESGVPVTSGTAVDGWNVLATTTYLSRASSASNPTLSSAQSGTYFLQWNSYSASSGTSATIYSPAFSLLGVNSPVLSMWVYRDVASYNTSTYAAEGFTAYVNTSSSLTGATSLGFVPRAGAVTTSGSYIAGTATTAASGWYQYTFTLPSTYSGSTNYILIKANSVYGDNCFLDNITLTGATYTGINTTTLTDAIAGGTWASGSTSIATINAATGVLTAVSQGNATVSYSNCSGTVTGTILVKDNPAAITGTTTVCAGGSSTLGNIALGGTWSSSNPAIASVNSATGCVTGVAAGSAVITYSNGCGNTVATTFTVLSAPVVSSVAASSSALCTGATLTLTAGTISGTGTVSSYNWSGPNGFSATGAATAVTVPSLTMAGSGVYSLTVTYSGMGCTSAPATTAAVSVLNYPAVHNVTGGNGCSSTGLAVGVDASQSGVSYSLKLLPSTTIQTISGSGSAISFSAVGNVGAYAVIAANTNGCQTTMAGNDTINQAPSIVIGSVPSVCQPATSVPVPYTGSIGSPSAYTIDWDATANAAGFIDGSFVPLGGGNINLSIPASGAVGSFTGTVTVTNGYCTSPAYTIHEQVYAAPAITVSAVNTPCAGYTGSIDLTGTNGAIVDYSVDGGSTYSFTFSGTTYSLTTGALSSAHSFIFVNAHNPVCSTAYNDTVVVTPTPMSWIGGAAGNETDWNTAANWSCGFVPGTSDDVTVNAAVYTPVIASSGTVRGLRLFGPLTINSGAVLSVKGSMADYNAVSGSGRVILNGTTSQLISGKGTIANLELNNSNGASVDSNSLIGIRNTLYITSGILATRDSLELLSDSGITARIAPILSPGASISGKVKVDQYVQGGYRRYRFWAHPFRDTILLCQLQSFIDITGLGGAANGFRTTPSNAPSAFRFDTYNSNSAMGYDPGWKPFTRINSAAADTNRLHPGQGIRLFFRGAKDEGLGYALNYTPSSVVVKMSGNVNQGPVTVRLAQGLVNPASQEYNLVGNPYASPVDIGTVLYNAKQAGQVTGSAFYVWNPTIGAGGQYMAIPIGISGASPYYIQANAAFQVRADHDGATLNFAESNKGASPDNILFKKAGDRVTLAIYDAGYHLWDQLNIDFNDAATNGNDRNYDATKPMGADFNFYSLSADGDKLAIDARPYNAATAIPLGVSSAYQQDFIIRANDVVSPGVQAVVLHDKLLGKYVEMTIGAEYHFSIGKEGNTQGNDRFELSLKNADTSLADKNMIIAMSPNPATDEVNVNYTVTGNGDVTLRIMDMSGVEVYNKNLGARTGGVITVPMGSFAAGVYLVEVTQGTQKLTRRLVKE